MAILTLVGYGYKSRYTGLENLRNRVSQSYAAAMVTLKMDEDGQIPYKPYHDVTVFHKLNHSPVRIPALSDQGNDVTLFTEDWAQKLGYNLQTDGVPLGVSGVGGNMAKHFVAVQGIMQLDPALKPVQTTFAFGDTPKNLLGRESILGRYNVTYTPTSVIYQETSSGFSNREEALSAYGRHGATANIQNGRRFQGNWRNRL